MPRPLPALRRFSAYLADEGLLSEDPLLTLRPPRVRSRVIEVLSPDELGRLLATASSRRPHDLRDASLTRRSRSAGLPDFHPHRPRAVAARRWIDSGGSTTGLLEVLGWSTVAMANFYLRSSNQAASLEEAARLDLDV